MDTILLIILILMFGATLAILYLNIKSKTKEVDKDNILGIKYDKIGLYQNLSIPFIKINSNIFPVFIDFNYNKDKIQEFLDSLKDKFYYNVDEDLLSPNFELIYNLKISGQIITSIFKKIE